MAIELRCDKRLHGILTDDGVIEISCRSALCGHRDGVVVIHRFDVETGVLIDTKRYKDPAGLTKKEQGDALGQRTTVRYEGHQVDPVHNGRSNNAGHQR